MEKQYKIEVNAKTKKHLSAREMEEVKRVLHKHQFCAEFSKFTVA